MMQDSDAGEEKEPIGDAIVRLVQKARDCWERRAWGESAGPLAEALRLAEAEAGPGSPFTAWVLRHTAWLATTTGRHADSVAEYRRALAIYEAAGGPEHPDVVSTWIQLAKALFSLGRSADRALEPAGDQEADELALRAVAAFDAAGREDLELAQCLDEAGWRRYFIGRYVDAEPLLARALDLFERLAGEADPRTARAAQRLGMAYEHGRLEVDAAPCYRKALAGREERLHDAHPDVLDARARLATYLGKTGRGEESAFHFDRLVATLLDDAAEIDWCEHRWYLGGCGQYLRDAGRLDDLEELERRAADYDVMVAIHREGLDDAEARYGTGSVEYAAALGELANSLADAGKGDEAFEAADRARAILVARLGPDDPAVAEAEERVETVRKAAEFHAGRPRRSRRLGREEPTLFGPLSTPWADERRGDLIRAYLDALAPADEDEGGDEVEDPTGALGAVTMLTFMADADEQWDFLRELIAAAPDDAGVLQGIAAGPLEGLLGRFDGEVIERVEKEAARDPTFRRVLSGVWKHGMSDAVWERVRAIQKTVADPLPEMRPFEGSDD